MTLIRKVTFVTRPTGQLGGPIPGTRTARSPLLARCLTRKPTPSDAKGRASLHFLTVVARHPRDTWPVTAALTGLCEGRTQVWRDDPAAWGTARGGRPGRAPENLRPERSPGAGSGVGAAGHGAPGGVCWPSARTATAGRGGPQRSHRNRNRFVPVSATAP